MILTAKRQSLTTKRAGHSGHCISFTDPSSLKSWLIWKKSTEAVAILLKGPRGL